MNKQGKLLLSCVLVLLALCGVLAAVLLLPEKPATDAPQTQVLPLALSEVTAVTVTNARGTVELTKTADGYAVKGLEGLSLSENAATLFTQASSLEAVRELPATDELTQYGLTEPETTAVITGTDGSQRLELGKESPSAGERYARLDGKLYLIKSTELSSFDNGPEDYVSVLVSQPLKADETVDTVELRHGNEIYSFTYVPESGNSTSDEEDAASQEVPAHYRMTAPVQADVDKYDVSVWANGAFGLSAQAVEAIRPGAGELVKYGLDVPETVVTLASSSGQTLRLSASAPRDGVCYLMRDGVPLIYRVSQSDVGWRTASTETLTKSVFGPVENGEVAALDVQGQGKQYRFVRENGTVTANGQTVDEDRFATVLDAALRIPPAFLGETAHPTLEPALTVTVSYGARRESDTLRLIPTGEGSLYLELNGTARFTAQDSYLDALLNACETALAPAESAAD